MEFFHKKHWYRKLCFFFKIYKNQCPKYRFDIILQCNCQCRITNAHNIPKIGLKHQFFKSSYFPSTIIEWNKLDSNIRNSETLEIFTSKILKFIRPTTNGIFGCHNPIGVKLLTRLRLGLSHLRDLKFRNNFQDTLNPFAVTVAEKKLKLLLFFSCQVPITLMKDLSP